LYCEGLALRTATTGKALKARGAATRFSHAQQAFLFLSMQKFENKVQKTENNGKFGDLRGAGNIDNGVAAGNFPDLPCLTQI
jgi:hypothetical protein